jgi:transposase
MVKQLSDDVRKALVQTYESATDLAKKAYVAKVFKGVASRTTIYRLLSVYDHTGSAVAKARPGRKKKLATPENLRRLREMVNNKAGVSDDLAGRRMGWSRAYVQRIRAKKLNIRKFKKRKAPYYKPGMETIVKKQARRLGRFGFPPGSEEFIVMDDEHYVYLDQSFCPQNKYFNAVSQKVAPPEIQIITDRKFCPKLMIWLAISMRGRSSVYFVPNKVNIDSEVYLRECVKKRLMPFLKKAYPDNSALFWPDKATAHYANIVKDFLAARNIKMVEWKNGKITPQVCPKHAQLNAIGPALMRSYIPIEPFPKISTF